MTAWIPFFCSLQLEGKMTTKFKNQKWKIKTLGCSRKFGNACIQRYSVSLCRTITSAHLNNTRKMKVSRIFAGRTISKITIRRFNKKIFEPANHLKFRICKKFQKAAPQILIIRTLIIFTKFKELYYTDDEQNNPDQVFCGVVIDEKRL